VYEQIAKNKRRTFLLLFFFVALIAAAALAFNFVGDGLREALDPRARR